MDDSTANVSVEEQVQANSVAISAIEEKLHTNHNELLALLRPDGGHQSSPLLPTASEEPSAKRVKLTWSDTLAQCWDKTPIEATLKLEGNKKRYESLWDLRDHVVNLESLLAADPALLNPAKITEALSDLKIQLADQLRMVRLADRNPAVGWALVDAYRADNLALSPDDERRIQRSGSQAAKVRSSTTRKRPIVSPMPLMQSSVRPPYQTPFRGNSRFTGSYPYRGSRGLNSDSSSSNGCHTCGQTGHWRDQCPLRNSSAK